MIYQDYMRRKMHNVVKLDTKEGYPLTVYSCANKNLKDYTITGNTVYGENLFNYTEPYNDNQIIADENGWYDVTIDNMEGTSTSFKTWYTAVNNALKPDTEYILFTEIAELTGGINVQTLSQYSDTKSQFTNAAIRYNKAGTYTDTITTLSSFDVCKTMLRSRCYCGAGRSGHAKFRIAVYETQKDEFLPYSKQSVGNLVTDETSEYYNKYKIPITVTGKNLFDKSISIRDDIKNETTITSSDYSVSILKNNDICKILKPDTTYTISCEFECTAIPSDSTYRHGVLGFIASTSVEGYSRISATIDKQMLVGERYKFSKTFTTPSNFGTEGKYSFVIYRNAYYKGDSTVAASMICRKLQIEEGTTATSYEPYHEHVTTNIYRDAQLGQCESINYKNDNLPDITLEKGTNIITADTEVKPSSIKIKYLKK